MWPQHQEPDRREPGRDSNFRAVYAYLATLLPTGIVGLGWFRYDTALPLSARQMDMLGYRKAKATS